MTLCSIRRWHATPWLIRFAVLVSLSMPARLPAADSDASECASVVATETVDSISVQTESARQRRSEDAKSRKLWSISASAWTHMAIIAAIAFLLPHLPSPPPPPPPIVLSFELTFEEEETMGAVFEIGSSAPASSAEASEVAEEPQEQTTEATHVEQVSNVPSRLESLRQRIQPTTPNARPVAAVSVPEPPPPPSPVSPSKTSPSNVAGSGAGDPLAAVGKARSAGEGLSGVVSAILGSGGLHDADIMIAIDVTGSMKPQIGSVQSHVKEILQQIQKNVDAGKSVRVGLIAFGDRIVSERVPLSGNRWDELLREVNGLNVHMFSEHNPDLPEGTLDALWYCAHNVSWRTHVPAHVILIHDNHDKAATWDGHSAAEVNQALALNNPPISLIRIKKGN